MKLNMKAKNRFLLKKILCENATSTIWSIIWIPIWILITLLVIDLGRIMVAESVIESALDSGALAGAFQVDGKYFKSSGGEIGFTRLYKKFVQDYFDKSLSSLFGAKTEVLTTRVEGDKVQARIEIRIPLLFGRIIGKDHVSFERRVTSGAYRIKLDGYVPVAPTIGSQ